MAITMAIVIVVVKATHSPCTQAMDSPRRAATTCIKGLCTQAPRFNRASIQVAVWQGSIGMTTPRARPPPTFRCHWVNHRPLTGITGSSSTTISIVAPPGQGKPQLVGAMVVWAVLVWLNKNIWGSRVTRGQYLAVEHTGGVVSVVTGLRGCSRFPTSKATLLIWSKDLGRISTTTTTTVNPRRSRWIKSPPEQCCGDT